MQEAIEFAYFLIFGGIAAFLCYLLWTTEFGPKDARPFFAVLGVIVFGFMSIICAVNVSDNLGRK